MTDIRENFSVNLKRIRKSRGYTQMRVAYDVGVETPTYNRWEKGKAWPNPEYVNALAEVLEVDSSDFYKANSPLKVKPSPEEALKVLTEALGAQVKFDKRSQLDLDDDILEMLKLIKNQDLLRTVLERIPDVKKSKGKNKKEVA